MEVLFDKVSGLVGYMDVMVASFVNRTLYTVFFFLA